MIRLINQYLIRSFIDQLILTDSYDLEIVTGDGEIIPVETIGIDHVGSVTIDLSVITYTKGRLIFS